MGLTDNFKQAAKELMDGPSKPQQETKVYQEPAVSQERRSSERVSTSSTVTASTQSTPSTPSTPITQTFSPVQSYRSVPEPETAATIISVGTVIQGTVYCEGNLELYGEVQGDINGSKDLKLQGKLNGAASGINVTLNGLQMTGDLHASGVAQVSEGSVVEGDVDAESLVLNGRVNGNVQVNTRLHLKSNGFIRGAVTAARLMVEEGAEIQGEIHIGTPQKELPKE
jgi:cytoskeletal protein CcmA (bactofilin family)